MVEEYEKVDLYYSAFPGKGIAWANTQLVIVPAGWNRLNSGRQEFTNTWTLFWYPDESTDEPVLEKLSFFKVGYIHEFVYLSYEANLRLEGSSAIQDRPKDLSLLPGYFPLTMEWIDNAFLTATDTDPENPYLLDFQKFQRKNTSAAKYARSEKGKLTQKKYRQSDTAKDSYEVRSQAKRDQRDNYKTVKKWLEDNPEKSLDEAPAVILQLL